ncbi:hypothetical protein P4310_28020 [Bacillus thuringiensis]|uniref:hypothetical protein n=1 Tax=Bacillus thuringiensis TaxID=1428 RepID=UPI000A3C4FBA|nr:hypothetical protein [Bacillus thuringiensis]MED3069289.1 hypothetical protein [Bacillus thuringiensis]OUB32008.1 hypothetical protein BK737_14245 [Bacillus thuringiensis serovar palmanyolensis]
MKRYYLPEIVVFKRYDHRVCNRLISGYHRKLASKNRYFVRHQLLKERPFYTDADLSEIISVLDDIEIINCEWTATEWNVTPWNYFVTSGKVYEGYKDMNAIPFTQGYSGDDIGKRTDDGFYFKCFKGNNCTYWRDRNYETPTWHLRYGNQYVNLRNDTFYVGIFGSTKATQSAPVDLVLLLLKQMNAKKWRGFYDDEIDFILEQTGIERRLI